MYQAYNILKETTYVQIKIVEFINKNDICNNNLNKNYFTLSLKKNL